MAAEFKFSVLDPGANCTYCKVPFLKKSKAYPPQQAYHLSLLGGKGFIISSRLYHILALAAS